MSDWRISLDRATSEEAAIGVGHFIAIPCAASISFASEVRFSRVGNCSFQSAMTIRLEQRMTNTSSVGTTELYRNSALSFYSWSERCDKVKIHSWRSIASLITQLTNFGTWNFTINSWGSILSVQSDQVADFWTPHQVQVWLWAVIVLFLVIFIASNQIARRVSISKRKLARQYAGEKRPSNACARTGKGCTRWVPGTVIAIVRKFAYRRTSKIALILGMSTSSQVIVIGAYWIINLILVVGGGTLLIYILISSVITHEF